MKKILFLFSILTIISTVYCTATWAETKTISVTINNYTTTLNSFSWSNGSTVKNIENLYQGATQQCQATITKKDGKYTIVINPDQLLMFEVGTGLKGCPYVAYSTFKAEIIDTGTGWVLIPTFIDNPHLPFHCSNNVSVTPTTGPPTAVTITLINPY